MVGALMAGCLAGPVYAQKNENPLKVDEDLKRKDDAEIDRQYKSTLQKTRKDAAETRPVDPWQNIRGAEEPKTKR